MCTALEHKSFNITPPPPNFTITREPLQRFVSAYSEIVFRNHKQTDLTDPIDRLEYRTFTNPIMRACAFIRDMVLCRLRHFAEDVSTHAFSQLSFLHSARISHFYRMEDLPKMNITSDVRLHKKTDATSQNPDRVAMESVLEDSRYKCALVQMYALDYVCLQYEVPKPCKIRQHLTCPYDILQFSAYNPLNYDKL
eukprot:m.152392 g.152392  ORF g.152392 m.152392 type:complete len:195 (-) comp15054_c1_seq3:438-1022(-)